MKTIDTRLLGIAQGSQMLFSDFEHDGEMWTGTGPRSHRAEVRFETPFATPPTVQVGVSMWDIDQKSNQRADISAEDITLEGFTIVFRTWGDTRVARIRADWLALGALPDTDLWEID